MEQLINTTLPLQWQKDFQPLYSKAVHPKFDTKTFEYKLQF